MPKAERQQRYIGKSAAAGLVRVEVLVPGEGRAKILALASELRREHRQSSALTKEQEGLFQEALDKYGARCLWNIQPERSKTGLSLIADRLRANGGMDAWKLASRIRKAIEHAL